MKNIAEVHKSAIRLLKLELWNLTPCGVVADYQVLEQPVISNYTATYYTNKHTESPCTKQHNSY
jgi:hypothetical protein